MVRSTHGVNCTGLLLVEGLRQGRDHHLGDPADRLPVGRARTARSTSPAAARAARPSPGTPTRPPGSATPTSAACCCRCTARPSPSTTATRSRPGRTSSTTRSAPRPTSPRAARAAWSGPRWDEATEMVAAAYVHTIRKWGPDRVAGFSPIPAMSMVSHASGARFTSLVGGSMLSFYDWYADLPGRLAPGVRRPDRRPGVRRLVGRRLPDHVGLQRAGHPHARRALDDRGPLPRPEGRRGRARLRRQREVRRRVAGDRARHRRRAGDVDGPRDPQGVLRRPADAVLHRLHEEVHRPALPGRARRGPADATAATYRAGKFLTAADLPEHAGEENAHFKTVLVDARTGEPGGAQRRARPPLRRRGRRQVEPRPRRRRPAADPARAGRRRPSPSSCRASTTSTGRRARCPATCRSAASATGWSPRSST